MNEELNLCQCDYPLVRTNINGGEYCANCNLDL